MVQPARMNIFKLSSPLLLLTIYPLILIPIVTYFMIQDIMVKREGFLVWHRDSIGLLAQRWVIGLLLMIAISVLDGCSANTNKNTEECVKEGLIPLAIPLVCIAVKVIMLKDQRIFFWGGFLVCLTAQIAILIAVTVNFRNSGYSNNSVLRPYLDAWLIFIPCMIFGLMVDLECLY